MGNRIAAAIMLLAVAGCPAGSGDPSSQPVDAGGDDRAQAAALLVAGAWLPKRPEVVALTDRLSIAASEAGAEAAPLNLLAARLRERVWRLDHTATDAREALELYATVVGQAAGTATSCEADRRHARLHGEMSHDAGAIYRALYIAIERQGSAPSEDDAHEACVSRLRAMLAMAEGFRPTGAAWQELQRDAAEQAGVQSARAATSADAPSAAASSSATPEMAAPEGDVVVVPDEAMVKSGNKTLARVQPYSMPLGGRVVLTLSEPARYEAGMLEPDPKAGRGHRIYLDLFDVRFKGIADHVDGKGFISGVRLGKRKFGTRVVIDLSDAATRRVFYLPDPFRVVIDLSTRVAASTARKVDDGKRFVTRVALDPGHGGWDAGAIGPTGLREKDVALDVAHRAAPALASELGIETMLTRDTDTFIELDERTARANAFQSDLFISIHCNATENGQASGLEVFIVDPSREQDAATLRAVARENHRKGAVMDPQLLDAQLSTIARGLGMGRNSHASRTFADLLRKSSMGSLSERFPFTADHGTKTASFFVLVGTEMPSVLYETAFISNPDDEARLATADYRQKLADAIVNAIRAYRDGVR